MRGKIFIAILLSALILRASGLNAQGFGGGPGDGYGSALSAAPAQLPPTGYYQGGPGDGFSTALSANFTYSANRFGGGGYDGYARALSPDNSFSLARYYGGAGDGYASAASILIKQQPESTLPLPGPATRLAAERGDRSPALRAWPSPFTDVLNLSLSAPEAQDAWMSLHDMSGRELHRVVLPEDGSIRMDLLSLPCGPYLVRMQWRQQGRPMQDYCTVIKGR